MAGTRKSEAAAASQETAAPAADTSPIQPTKEQTLHATKSLLALVALYNAMVDANLADLFPADIPASVVRGLIVKELDASTTLAAAEKKQTTVISRRDSDEKGALKLLGRMKSLVDSAYPAGHPARAAFFPGSSGSQTLGTQLEAMANGLSQHGLPKLPQDISVVILVTHAHAVADDSTARAQAGTQRQGASGIHRGLTLQLREVRKRLGQALRGFFGPENPALTQFGLKPRLPVTHHRKKATPAQLAARKAAREQEKARKAQEKAQRKAERAQEATANNATAGGTDPTKP